MKEIQTGTVKISGNKAVANINVGNSRMLKQCSQPPLKMAIAHSLMT